MNFWDDYGAAADLPSVMDVIPGQYHADILLGTSTVDVSSYINDALGRYGFVRLPLRGQLSVGSPLRVPSGGGIFGYSYQCTIKALPNFGNSPVVQNRFTAPTRDDLRDRNITLTGFRIDGNRANNTTATEHGHGVKLFAVDGCTIDLLVVECHGDGLCVLYADYPHMEIGSRAVVGRIRTQNCSRHGVAIICGENLNLDIVDEGTALMSLDIEPDDPLNIIRNCFFRVLSRGSGNGTEVSGGFCCAGDGRGCLPTNITIDFEVHESRGYGGMWRDAINLTLRGSIHQPARAGLVGLDGGVGPSSVYFDGVRVNTPRFGGLVARETSGSIYDGSIYIRNSGTVGAQIENAGGGLLSLRVQYAGEDGLYLSNTRNVIFPNLVIHGSRNNNLWLRNASASNRFPGMRNTSAGQYGVLEDTGCNDNKSTNAQTANNQGGALLLAGQSSYVLPEA